MRSSSSVLRFLPLLALLLSGCSEGDGRNGAGSSDAVVRDSAGITIVENAAGSEEGAPTWTVGPEPLLQIGAETGELPYLFTQIPAVTSLSDGTVVVLDAGTREVRYFNAAGAHIATAGGMGEGPGEFRQPTVIQGLPGDTLMVWDAHGQARRFTFFTSRGELAGTYSSPTRFNFGTPGPVGFIVGRTLLTVSGWADTPPPAEDGLWTGWGAFLRVELSEAGEVMDTLAILQGSQRYRHTRVEVPVPFTQPQIYGVGGGEVAIGYADRREIAVFDSGGQLTRIARVLGEATPLTRELFQEEANRRIAALPPEAQEVRQTAHEAMPIPSTIPAWSPLTLTSGQHRLLVGESGGIWVMHFRPEGASAPLNASSAPSRWTVFDREGRVEATAELPSGFTPHEILSAGVLGVQVDELGLPWVHLLEIRR